MNRVGETRLARGAPGLLRTMGFSPAGLVIDNSGVIS